MSTWLTSALQREHWAIGDQTWSRNPATGVFELADYKGWGAPPQACDPLDLAPLVGARVSVDGADRAGKSVALYPGPFKFSPVTGKALPAPSAAHRGTWLPPFGGDSATEDSPQGLRLTAAPLALRSTLSIESLPDRQLAAPPAGHYQFLVSACQTCDARLLAMEFSRGRIYHWLPHSERWLELRPAGAQALGRSSLGQEAWGMALHDPQGASRIFMPTDDGLAIVSINLIAGTFQSHVVGTRCLGAPILWQDKVYVPMLQDDGKLGVHGLDPAGTALFRVEGPGLDAAPAAWVRPLADRRQIVWMSAAGQLLVKAGDGDRLETSLLPWPPGVVPSFELGSPYLSRSGHLWQQCALQEGGTEGEGGQRFAFVQLGLREPEIRPASSPRLSTGAACFQRDARLRIAPWFDADISMDSEAGEVVIPLLESTSASTVLCARVASTAATDTLFASNEAHTATFELHGENDVQFWVASLPRPWATQPFVYAGHLYLYHPDKRRLPGWRIDP
ncbi:hypothetical protein H6CHR_01528 [Variovorax sp. PBL-H6]|uniref:hypothetical protein n=1 Tax=Variovorax sp. PBL-H6 TaxID=434009 RepID=UPI0013169BE3|nr:hypothetical protein [Variovorax sp. PBL-H6]VTU21133.1 hypothetical protein H6CHR_01528 [Variovorax sp. PBL-H6]